MVPKDDINVFYLTLKIVDGFEYLLKPTFQFMDLKGSANHWDTKISRHALV